MNTQYLYGLALATTMVAAGCGGSNTDATTGAGAGAPSRVSTPVPTLATSNYDKRFNHFYVKVIAVDLINSTTARRVFNNPLGQVLDVTTIGQTVPKFLLLGSSSINLNSFSSVKVTLAKKTTVINAGLTKGVVRNFAPQFNNPSNLNQSIVTFPLGTATVVGAPKLVVNMGLNHWSFDSKGEVHPSMSQGDGRGSDDPNGCEAEDNKGIVSGLTGTAPTQIFSINGITVNTDANTVIVNNDNSANPALANGERVEVTGTLVNGSVLATRIQIDVQHDLEDDAEADGLASNLDATAGTLTITIQKAKNFLPTGTTINVATTATTKFVLNGAVVSQADFFTGLAAGLATMEVEAEGSVDANGLLTAVTLKAGSEDGDGGGSGGGGGPH